MRRSRTRKFKKGYSSFISTLKVVFIMYFGLFSLSMLTTNTNALFISSVRNESSIKASWEEKTPPKEIWDKSSLAFWNEEFGKKLTGMNKNKKGGNLTDHYGISCEDGLFAEIINDGEAMKGTSIYLVRYSSSKDINKNKPGVIIYKGEIPKMNNLEIKRLRYLPTFEDGLFKPGTYKFSALQRPLHPGGKQNLSKEYPGRFEIWAETSVVVTEDMINACKMPVVNKASEQESQTIEDKPAGQEKKVAEPVTTENNSTTVPKPSTDEKEKNVEENKQEEHKVEKTEEVKEQAQDTTQTENKTETSQEEDGTDDTQNEEEVASEKEGG